MRLQGSAVVRAHNMRSSRKRWKECANVEECTCDACESGQIDDNRHALLQCEGKEGKLTTARRVRDGSIDRALQKRDASFRMDDLDEYEAEMMLLGVPVRSELRECHDSAGAEENAKAERCMVEILRASAQYLRALRQNRG